MNEYLRNLSRIEIAVTGSCTGKCRHCQNGDSTQSTGHLDTQAVLEALRSVCSRYPIDTLMVFGGEPLLFPDTVCAIHREAAKLGIGSRQVITSGYFSKNSGMIERTARDLAESGVNDLMLSVDAFHQETIPFEPVMYFAECLIKASVPVRLQPAWLVSREDGNACNLRTKEILRRFESLGIPEGEGNVVFPAGNALKYLREYFAPGVLPSSPYEEDPRDIRSLSFSADGGVLGGNIYETDILEIIRTYSPVPEEEKEN
ncbi:MAG: radical SAM protein [Eubacteriaceae bacterium]|nr:radical SAM protein [Eubacteriaceae bacterium]